ncbi:uncharacterized protein LOC123635689 [Lemur catta]|uniref:uncharacterized protein LOC123635689 n=1 Tax=Lemur catta TaxID=9447 RepID=UPI001E26CF5E|nr:uncharacterized protein LOC123635689 [Lemur catta]
MNSVQKNEHEKSLEHSKKRSRPSLLRPVSAPAKVRALRGGAEGCLVLGRRGPTGRAPGLDPAQQGAAAVPTPAVGAAPSGSGLLLGPAARARLHAPGRQPQVHQPVSPLCRQLAEVALERYLSGPEGAKRHSILADFFSGAWGQGTKKLITLPLVGTPLNLDHEVKSPGPLLPTCSLHPAEPSPYSLSLLLSPEKCHTPPPWTLFSPYPLPYPSPGHGGRRVCWSPIVSLSPPALSGLAHVCFQAAASLLPCQVAPQPLWFSDTVANVWKLEELPCHLLHSGRWEELKQEVLGSMSWISCQGLSGETEDLLDDFNLCAPYLDCPEVSLVREALQLCHPAVELRGTQRSLLYTELLARLYFFAPWHETLVGPAKLVPGVPTPCAGAPWRIPPALGRTPPGDPDWMSQRDLR